MSLGLPYERVLNMGFVFPADERQRIASVMYGSTDLFTTFGIAMRAGRAFQAGDIAERPMSGAEREIVGVVADVQMRPGFMLDGMVPGPIVTSPTVYLPAAQISQGIVGTPVWFPPVWTVRAAATTEQRLLMTLVGSLASSASDWRLAPRLAARCGRSWWAGSSWRLRVAAWVPSWPCQPPI